MTPFFLLDMTPAAVEATAGERSVGDGSDPMAVDLAARPSPAAAAAVEAGEGAGAENGCNASGHTTTPVSGNNCLQFIKII